MEFEPGMVVQIHKSKAQEAETEKSKVQGQPRLYGETRLKVTEIDTHTYIHARRHSHTCPVALFWLWNSNPASASPVAETTGICLCTWLQFYFTSPSGLQIFPGFPPLNAWNSASTGSWKISCLFTFNSNNNLILLTSFLIHSSKYSWLLSWHSFFYWLLFLFFFFFIYFLFLAYFPLLDLFPLFWDSHTISSASVVTFV